MVPVPVKVNAAEPFKLTIKFNAAGVAVNDTVVVPAMLRPNAPLAVTVPFNWAVRRAVMSPHLRGIIQAPPEQNPRGIDVSRQFIAVLQRPRFRSDPLFW
jgi:hypothetical protein